MTPELHREGDNAPEEIARYLLTVETLTWEDPKTRRCILECVRLPGAEEYRCLDERVEEFWVWLQINRSAPREGIELLRIWGNKQVRFSGLVMSHGGRQGAGEAIKQFRQRIGLPERFDFTVDEIRQSWPGGDGNNDFYFPGDIAMAAYRQHPEWQADHPEAYLAVADGQLFDTDPDQKELQKRIYQAQREGGKPFRAVIIVPKNIS